MAKKINAEQYKDDFLKRYNEGESIRSIARTYGMAQTTVSRVISKYQEFRVPRGKQPEVLNQIYPLYAQGCLVHHIAQQLGIGTGTVRKHLELTHGVKTGGGGSQTPKFEHLAEDFKKEYLRGDTLTEIAKRHGVSRQTVLNYLNRNRVEARDYSEANRIYPINEDYFDILDTKKSRQLGLIYGYGILIDDIRAGKILRLLSKEGCEPLFFEAFEGITTHLEERLHYNKKDGIAILQVYSAKICEQLEKWDFPNQLPNSTLLDEDAFWEGFLQARISFGKSQRPTVYISFPSKELESVFKDYIHHLFEGKFELKGEKGKTVYFQRKSLVKMFFNRFPFLLNEIPDKAEGMLKLKNEGYFDEEMEVTTDKAMK